MVTEGECTITTLLKPYNFQQQSKHLFLHTQISVIITLHQRNFSLLQSEITTGNYKQSICKAVEPQFKWRQLLPTTHVIFWNKRQKDCKKPRISEFAVNWSLLIMSKYTLSLVKMYVFTHIKSHLCLFNMI